MKLLRSVLLISTLLYCGISCLEAEASSHKEEEANSDAVCGTDQYNYTNTIYVDPSVTTDCDPKTAQDRLNVTCQDINTALHFHRDSTAFVLMPGTHILKPDANNSITFFREQSDLGFFGESGDVANIECEGGAGLAFWNVNRITIQNVTFSFCGALRNTTSRNFANDTGLPVTVMVGAFFYNGSDVTMCHVTVQHGVNALGVLMYDTDGTVNVYYSHFVNNSNTTEQEAGGGGFNVEFSYCVLGDPACNASGPQATHNSNSNYTFRNCTFVENSGVASGAVRVIPHNQIHQGMGSGGGLAILFKNNATNNRFRIIFCHFRKNIALWGGGLYVMFGDTSIGNQVSVDEAFFVENSCHPTSGVGGGAIRIHPVLNFHKGPLIDSSVKGNTISISGYFYGNRALQGGAISFSPAYQTRLREEQTTHLRIMDSVFYENSARLGAAIHTELDPLFVYGSISNVTIENCIFQSNSIKDDKGSTNYDIGIGTIYTYQVSLSFQALVEFKNNFGSALALTSTHATFYDCLVVFVNNTGDTGGGIAFLGSSHALVNENTSMHFENNFAAQKGGAIYNFITGQGDMKSNTACFIRYFDPFKDRKDWRASFNFTNNTAANNAGNSIYTTSVYPCALGNIIESMELTNVLLFCNNSNWNFEDSSCGDQIQTAGKLYDFDPAIRIFPGKGFDLPINVSDDLNHDITDTTGYTSIVSNLTLAKVDPKYTLTSDNYLIITGQENVTVRLELQSSGSRPHYLEMNVTLQQCPPGLHFNNKTLECECKSQYTYGKNLNCFEQKFEASIPWNKWLGIDPTGERKDQLVMAALPNLYSEQKSVSIPTLPQSYDKLDEHICGIRNRTGPICGKCKANYSTSINSYNYICTPCDDNTNMVKNIFIFLITAYLPYILLLGAVAYFNLKFTSSAANGFILYAQMISLDIFDINGSSRISFNTDGLHKAYLFVYGIFNFNSFATVLKPFCIGKNFTALHVLCIDYTLAALPILFIISIYFLLRLKSIKFLCCRKERLSIQASPSQSVSPQDAPKKSSLIHALMAFILLSYTKITLVSMKILSTIKVFDEDGHYLSDPRVYLAGHLSFYSREFLIPYGMIALIMMAIFASIPPLFLIGIPQLIDRLLEKERFACFKRVWPTVTVHIFLDAFQGFYKPNRYIFAGFYFVFRLAILILYVTSSDYMSMYIFQQLFIVLMMLLLAIFKPYKEEVHNTVDVLIFLNLALINMISTYVYASSLTVAGLEDKTAKSVYIIQYCLLWAPLIYMLSYLAFKLLVKMDCIERLRSRSPIYFNPISTTNIESSHVDSEDEKLLDEKKFLTDSALFNRAEDTNEYCPPARKHMSMVGVVSGGWQ